MKENKEKKPRPRNYHPMRAKLIFNPSAGAARITPIKIEDVIHEMQSWKLVPEAYLVEPDSDLARVVKDALADGMRMFVVCGGDGTISTVARTLAGTNATLGIIPIGTQNNTALSLGIPNEVPDAVAILRKGKRIKVDVGIASIEKTDTIFLEVCSVGLISTLFPSADDIQHGNVARVGDFLATLVTSPPAEIHLLLDNKKEINSQGHIVLVSNMPYIGFHYQVGHTSSYKDGLLDVLFFADLTKLELLNYVFQGVGVGKPEDPRIQHYHVHSVEISTKPEMQVMADGNPLGDGKVCIEVQPRALKVIVARKWLEEQEAPGENIKKPSDDEELA